MAQFPNLANITIQSSMRVLQLIDNLHAGGAERMAVQIANALHRRLGYSALCCTREEGLLKEQLKAEVDYLHAHRKGILGIIGIYKIYLFIKKNKITHLHAHSSSYFIAGFLKLLKPRLFLIWHDHNGMRINHEPENFPFLKSWSKKFNNIISVSPALFDWSVLNLKTRNVVILYNFVVNPSGDGIDIKIRASSPLRIVCLANIRPEKNHYLLLRAFCEIVKTSPDIQLDLVGNISDRKIYDDLIEIISSQGLNNKVHFHGTVDAVHTLLNKCHLGVLSSDYEGLPMALLEYGVAGLPVVCTNVGACQEVIGELGFLTPPNNQIALQSAISNLVQNEQLRNKLGSEFRKRVLRKYGEKDYLDKLLMIYNSAHD